MTNELDVLIKEVSEEKEAILKSWWYFFGFGRSKLWAIDALLKSINGAKQAIKTYDLILNHSNDRLSNKEKELSNLLNDNNNLKAIITDNDAEIRRLKEIINQRNDLICLVEKHLTRANFRDAQDSKVKMMLRDVDKVIGDYKAGVL